MPGTCIQYPSLGRNSSGGVANSGVDNDAQSSLSTTIPPSSDNNNISNNLRSRRLRKNLKHQHRPSSSDERSSASAKRTKKNAKTKQVFPMPAAAASVMVDDYDLEDKTPQVLLWQTSKRLTRSESSSSSMDGVPQVPQPQPSWQPEERCTSSTDFVAGDVDGQEAFDRQAPSSSTTFGDTSSDGAPLQLLANNSPQWFELDYWKQRLSFDNCWLPRRSSSHHHQFATPPRRTSSGPSYLEHRPPYVGCHAMSDRGSPWLASKQQQQPSVYYCMPPTRETTGSHLAYSPPSAFGLPNTHNWYTSGWESWPRPGHHQHLNPPQVQKQQVVGNDFPVTLAARDVQKDQKLYTLGSTVSHNVASLPVEPEVVPVQLQRVGSNDAQSVSSLESFQSERFTTSRQHFGTVTMPLDILPTAAEGTAQPTLSSSVSSAVSNRVAKLPSLPRTSSPRPLKKPPVPPARRGSSISNNTNGGQGKPRPNFAATPMPMLPPIGSNNNSTTVVGSRPRADSEASANTTGSRHRRGGTVCEFSFESNAPTDKKSPNNQKQINSPINRPALASRCTSLPPNLQGPKSHHSTNNPAPVPPPITVHLKLDATSDHTLVFLDGIQRASSAASTIEDNESGYISPLEEEEHMIKSITTAVASPSPRAGAYASDESPQSNNPQDSLCGDDRVGQEPLVKQPVVVVSPFAKLMDPPRATIPAGGEAWMYQWAQQDNASEIAPEPMSTMTATQTFSSPTKSSMNSFVSLPLHQSPSHQPPKPHKPPVVQELVVPSEYLPKNQSLEQKWKSKHASEWDDIALSGWVAFGMGESLIEKLNNDTALLDRKDVAYIIAPSTSTGLWVSRPDGNFENVLELNDCHIEVQEVSRSHGRAVLVKRQAQTVCTLLPVCLPQNYNGCRQLFDPRQCFPEGAYLPDEQQYTTMHIMFALDALLKANQKWNY